MSDEPQLLLGADHTHFGAGTTKLAGGEDVDFFMLSAAYRI
jgi:hypothetical protein